jgi:exopolysaccharide biosynthesis polyprenyl glycosylphosphotransferase
LNRVGAATSFDVADFEKFEVASSRLGARVQEEVSPSIEEGVSPSIEQPYWMSRRFHATREIGDGEHVEPLAAVRTSLSREQVYRRALATADALAAVGVALATAILWAGRPLLLLAVVPVAAILIAKIQGLYDRDDMVVRKSTVYEWRALLRANTMTTVAAYVIWIAVTPPTDGRGIRICAFMLASFFLLSLPARSLARRFARSVTTSERCLIVGSPAQCARLARRLSGAPGVEFIGTVPDEDVDCSVAGVYELVEQLEAERIVVVPHPGWGERGSVKLVQSAKWLGVRVSLMPTVMTVVGASTTTDEFEGLILLGVPRFGLSRSSALLKRALDLSLGGVVLVLAAPFMAMLAVAVRLDSPGPVLFRQKRIGRGGERFAIYKFRSMVDGAEKMQAKLHARNETKGLFKMRDDPRVTRLGRFMRRTYLDELPQLFNVMKGEMSLVGPRPLIEAEDVLLLGYDRHRSRLTPGMTGPWQLRGPMNATLSELAELDYMYASNWSIWADIDILLGTAARVVTRHGQ